MYAIRSYYGKYYLHRRVKAAGFSIELQQTQKTISVMPAQVEKAKKNKYVNELKNQFRYRNNFV